MTYIEFADAVEKMMNKKMKGGVRASLYTAMKNNGKERTGILIEMCVNSMRIGGSCGVYPGFSLFL